MELLIGSKPLKAYLLYAMSMVAKEDKLLLKARGRSIAKAVDLAEILKRKVNNLSVSTISIGTEVLEDKTTKNNIRLSTMEIECLVQK